jgi:glutathione-regulated potassium-efflux system ancillary protein KefC
MEEVHTTSWLLTSLVYLGAAVLAVPLARLAGLGSIIGYLAAGIVIGPWGLKLVTMRKRCCIFAEFGVVLMLFLSGWSWSRAGCGHASGRSSAGARCRRWARPR